MIPKNSFCKTRYPVVLAHGLGVRDEEDGEAYWGRIPALLRACGAAVYLGGQDAWGGIETNAAQLWRTARAAMWEQGAPRVNIIAHSKGGLEARYLISSMGRGRYIASLSMLATPNRGARAAEAILRARHGVQLWAGRNDAFWRRHGDIHPDSLLAGVQLTPVYLKQFNRDNPDAACVYYQSWGAYLDGARDDRRMARTHLLFYLLHSRSDGLVTPASARWGVYRGTLRGVSHRQLADRLRRDTPAFAPTLFYPCLVHELARMGF